MSSIEHLGDARMRVRFIDGIVGAVEMQAFLSDPGVVGTVFEQLRQQEFFRLATVVGGAVTWPNGADLAPDAMHDAILEHGTWVVE